MESVTNKQPFPETSQRRLPSLDRALLVGIMVLQIAILARMFSRPVAPAVPAVVADVPAKGCTPGQTAPQQGWNSEIDRAADSIFNADFPAMSALLSAQRMQARMDSALEHAMQDLAWMGDMLDIDRGWESVLTSPVMDLRDSGDAYVVMFGLPGTRAPDVAVTLEGCLLTISGVARVMTGGTVRSGRSFERRIRLPGPVRGSGEATASLTNGVLRVVVPKGNGGDRAPARLRLL
jgi:HSP20 family molecular chaperone IbpA